MANYRLFSTEEFDASVKKLPKNLSPQLTKELESYVFPQLKQLPHYGNHIKKLKGRLGVWRYRIGNFRIFYSINETEKVVYLLTIDHRKDAYTSHS